MSQGVNTVADMPRLARLYRPGERHHVTNRTSRRNPAFLDDADRKFFLWLLSEMYERFEVEVEAFALMTNHYHLLLEGNLEQLARAMHRLGFLYTQYFNNRHELRGPLFSSRFYSSPVNDPSYHANVLRYIHRNPLAIDPAMDLARYEWSSYGEYLGLRHAHWLPTDPGLELFDGSISRFQEFVEDDRNDISIPTLADLHDVVAAVTHTAMNEVVRRKNSGQPNEALLLFCLLAYEVNEASSKEIGTYVGIPPSTVRRMLINARQERDAKVRLQFLTEQAQQKLGPIPDLPTWWTDSWEL